MALRSDTSYQFDYVDSAVRRREPVILTPWDKLLDNQDLLLRERRMLVSSMEPVLNIDKHTAGDELWRGRFPGKPRMGTSIGTLVAATLCYVKVWCSAATNFTVRLSDGSNNDDLAVTATHTTQSWRALTVANVVLARDGTPTTLTVTLQTTINPDVVYFGGIFMAKDD